MTHLALSLLGPFQATLDGTPVTAFESDKVRALLAYLAVEGNRPQRRETLAGLLWPDMSERDARTNLRHVLANLRTALNDRDTEQPFLLTSRQTIQFNGESDYRLDVKAFSDAITATVVHQHTTLEACETCIARLREAATLYNGDFLAGFSLDSDLFEEWTTVQRERLHIQALDVLDHLATYHKQRGDYAEVVRYAQRQVELEPWRESAHRQWMWALAHSGQRGMALAQYEACRRILEAELGIEPEAATTALYESIRRGELQPQVKPADTPLIPPEALGPVSDRVPLPPVSPAPSVTVPLPEGERRMVTLLLADVRGTTTLLQHVDTEAWAELITPALHLLGSEIARLGGNVEQYRRDGVTACFGGQIAHEDDPERAVLAALVMQDALTAYLTENDAADLELTVSVHTGEVILTALGDTVSMMGDVLDSAECIQAALEPGATWVSDATHRLIAPLFTWTSRDDTGHQPLAHRPQAGKGRGIEGLSSPLVGRDAELRALQETVERLQAGIGGIVTVVGEAGIGKSRLVAEIKRSAISGQPSADLSWVEGRCLSYATSSAYQVWRDILHAWLGTAPDAAPAATVNTLHQRVLAVCPDAFNDVYPFLTWLLSLPLDAAATTRLRGIDAEGMQVLTFRAVETLLDYAAQQTPMVIFCEDLHSADATSLALLEHLLALTDRVPLLFVCAFRPEHDHGCWHIREIAARTYEHHHTDIRLNALSLTESTQLVGNLLSSDALPQELRARILERAEGNPFYVEEIVRSLIDDKIIAYDEAAGQWHAMREMDERTLPDTLYGVLMARVDRLPVGAKRVLQLASVIGRIFSYPMLAAIAERSTLDAHLVTLQRAQMIHERARLPERDYIFHHQFTLEAAYGGLLRRARRVLHRRMAEVLETLYPERIEENFGLLAHHWEQAADTDRAIAYLRRAGEQAAERYANAEAVAYFSRALDLLSTDRLEERLMFLLAREEIHHLQGMLDAQQQDLHALQEVGALLDDQSALVTVTLRRARYMQQTEDQLSTSFLLQKTIQEILPMIEAIPDVQDKAQSYLEWGRLQGGEGVLKKAIQLAHSAGLKAIEAESLRELGVMFWIQRDLEQAILYLERSLQLNREIGNRRLEGMICNALSEVLSATGNDTEAQCYAELGIRRCHETGNRYDEGWGISQLAAICYHQGAYAAALHYAQRGMTLAVEAQAVALGFGALAGVTRVFRDLGQYAEALVYYEHVLHDVHETGNSVMASVVLAYLGLYAHYGGDDVQAQACGWEMLRILQALDQKVPQVWAWIVVGRALTGLGQLDEARDVYQHVLGDGLSLWAEYQILIPAGLAHIALLKGRTEALQEALPYVEEILRYWEAHPALRDVLFEPFEMCWTCYHLLKALHDPRAPEVLDRVYALVQAQAARIKDPAHLRAFLENVTTHREIVAEWERVHTGDQNAKSGSKTKMQSA